MSKYSYTSFINILFCINLAFIFGCSTQQDNVKNRGLQNLSALYNYIYNSNLLLNTYQEELSKIHKDNYDDILPVYISPEQINYSSATVSVGNNKSLAEIAQKAQTIVAEKALSNYVDEAYILLGKTNFYNGNYFTASAYFDYTSRAYKDITKIRLSGLTWKARSLMQLNDYPKASSTLDTVIILLDSIKKEKVEPLATLAQFYIKQEEYKKAIIYLEKAVKESNTPQTKTRWRFILAQLYENDKKYDESLKNYSKVENSNAPFEMYFNAKLNKIRIGNLIAGKSFNRKQQLLKLLKDDKNFDYNDQVYYEVAEDYFAEKDYNKAEEFYKLSATKSIINQYQKGLTYLKLADLNFKSLGNYVNAKLYYDSAASTLPKTYRGYDAILKKAENLEYLTQRYEIISAQDSLQMMAKMPNDERNRKINEMFEPKKELLINPKLGDNIRQGAKEDRKNENNGTYYFSNAAAISAGYSDFKKKWGNRELADNWRQSLKSSAQTSQQNQNAVIGNTSTTSQEQVTAVLDKSEKIKAYIALLPITDGQLLNSNQQIIDSYFEIASFYQQVLGDQEEAIKTYETLLNRFPQNEYLDAIYYSLYLGYGKNDIAKATQFKNLVLVKYPNSDYAKTILDPNFYAKQSALELAVNKIYNSVFSYYVNKDYKAVINNVNENNQRFPENNLNAQFDYLKAIAIGRTENVDSLLNAFNQIIAKYPNDELITPLVKDHIAYINTKLSTFKARKIALIDFDGNEPRFMTQSESPTIALNPSPKITEPKPVLPELKLPTPVPNVTDFNDSTTKVPSTTEKLFTKSESGTFYYVIAVSDVTVSVSSSRFGVGQFNRGNFPGTGLKHQLQELEDDQLIFVGNFGTLNDVKAYADGITNQLSKIMKVPLSKYKGFFISEVNFEKIKNRDTLNRYIEFFKDNY